MRDQVDLVEHVKRRSFASAKLIQNLVDDSPLLFPSRMTRVDYMQEQIGLCNFFKRCSERCDEIVRKLPAEPHRIRQQHIRILREVNLPRKRIESREKPVFDEYRLL